MANPSILVSLPIQTPTLQIGTFIILFDFLCLYLFIYLFFRWVFEKYDGIRGFWNPLKKAMFSRGGHKLSLPQEVLDDMPGDLFLDGELW